MELSPGDVLDDKYRIVRLLGQGGMGDVYEAEHARIGRRVAIKVLNEVAARDAELVQRFEREAQAAARIGSGHIVDVLDLGSMPSGERFMVMELLEGESLQERLEREGRLEPAAIFRVAVELLEALELAHAAGIVHRDLKPHNVYLLRERDGRADFVKILDFGVSKFRSGGDAAMQMTRTGAMLGTPYYMSPEQARGARDIDHRADLFSVGVILFKAIAGRFHFVVNDFHDLMFKLALEDSPALATVVDGVDPEVSRIVATALARDPAARYPSALAFADALRGWLTTQGEPLPEISAAVRLRRDELARAPRAPAPEIREEAALRATKVEREASPTGDPARAATTLGGSGALVTSQGGAPARSRHLVLGMGAAAVAVVGWLVWRGGAEPAAPGAAAPPAASDARPAATASPGAVDTPAPHAPSAAPAAGAPASATSGAAGPRASAAPGRSGQPTPPRASAVTTSSAGPPTATASTPQPGRIMRRSIE
jgi:serine/threonine-protein kinase